MQKSSKKLQACFTSHICANESKGILPVLKRVALAVGVLRLAPGSFDVGDFHQIV